jgi:hypothetical protein
VQDVVVQSRWYLGDGVMALMTEEREDLGGVCLDFPALEGFAQNTRSDVYHGPLFSRVGLEGEDEAVGVDGSV